MKSKKTAKQLKAVDFFCCAGGVTHGFRKAGINVLAGIDIEGDYKETYEKNNKGSKFIEADISSLNPIDLEQMLGIRPNMNDLIFVGCSPCQYYTTLQTDKTKSSGGKLLLEEFRRFVEYFNPAYIFVENVPGLETKDGSPLSNFKNFLAEKGYSMDDNVVNAAEFQVPQNRRRYVLLASRLKAKITVPKGNPNKIKTARQAIGNMPVVPYGFKDKAKLKHWTAKLQPINVKRIKKTSHDGGTRLEWKNDPELQLKCYIGKDNTFSDVYGRMFWDQPAPTITTKFHSITNGRFGHPDQNRGLSLREGAILQSFPKSYDFIANNNAVVARMIGNAVPPFLAMAVGKNLVQHHQSILNEKTPAKKNSQKIA